MAVNDQTHARPPCECEGSGWISCERCDGDGYVHDCGEDSCCCADPDANYPCADCASNGGWPCNCGAVDAD